jgi:anti-sigma factor ChrR (cupin superfamily)
MNDGSGGRGAHGFTDGGSELRRECRMASPCRNVVELYALGLLDGAEAKEFEAHLRTCDSCRADLKVDHSLLAGLTASVPPRAAIRDRLLDFTHAPRAPLDLAALEWEEIAPGVRLHIVRDEAPRGVRSQIMWSEPGARRPPHRHLGDEDILILEGGLVVGDGLYASGEICRVRAGRFHVEEAANGGRCVSYLVHRIAEIGGDLGGAPDDRCLNCGFYAIHAAPFSLKPVGPLLGRS